MLRRSIYQSTPESYIFLFLWLLGSRFLKLLKQILRDKESSTIQETHTGLARADQGWRGKRSPTLAAGDRMVLCGSAGRGWEFEYTCKSSPMTRHSKGRLAGRSNQINRARIAVERELEAQAYCRIKKLPDLTAKAKNKIILRQLLKQRRRRCHGPSGRI